MTTRQKARFLGRPELAAPHLFSVFRPSPREMNRDLGTSHPKILNHGLINKYLLEKLKQRLYLFFKDFMYIFLERGAGRERGKETLMCGCLLCAHYWGPGLQPMHMPLLGIKPATLWFVGWCSIH